MTSPLLDTDNFIADYENHVSFKEMLDKYGLSEWNYRKLIRELNLPNHRIYLDNISESIKSNILSDAKNGVNASELSRIYHLNRSVIRRFLIRNNISPINGSIKYNFENDAEDIVSKYIYDNKSVHTISKEYNCSTAVIKNILKRNNVELRNMSEIASLKVLTGNCNKGYLHTRLSYSSKSGKEYKLRSSWELLTAQYLDSLNLIWKFEYKSYCLGYFTYIPDFFIFKENGQLDYLIEVKGRIKDRDLQKIMLMEEMYPDTPLYLWDKEIIDVLKKEVA